MAEGTINKTGANAGAVVSTTIISSFVSPTANTKIFVTEFSAEMASGGTDGVFTFQMSNDGFVFNIVEKDRIVMPSAGTFMKSYESGLLIPPGYSGRVLFVQLVAGAVAVALSGETENPVDAPGTDILDL